MSMFKNESFASAIRLPTPQRTRLLISYSCESALSARKEDHGHEPRSGSGTLADGVLPALPFVLEIGWYVRLVE